jgi:HD-GYP domain-containing protein (c-di-GMP phosphodiesterase class II)
MAEIDRQRRKQFDPALVDAFLRMLEQREPEPSEAEVPREDAV